MYNTMTYKLASPFSQLVLSILPVFLCSLVRLDDHFLLVRVSRIRIHHTELDVVVANGNSDHFAERFVLDLTNSSRLRLGGTIRHGLALVANWSIACLVEVPLLARARDELAGQILLGVQDTSFRRANLFVVRDSTRLLHQTTTARGTRRLERRHEYMRLRRIIVLYRAG
jgi:hypothetical protein